jgi:fumarate reductase (CoM/CoB) subunit A
VNGGVLIDERAATTMHGLYAAGEVAAGPHGADRLDGGW